MQKYPPIRQILTDDDRRRIADAALKAINERLDNGYNIDDAEALPYSQYGPIYLPLTHGSRTSKSLGKQFSMSRRAAKRQNRILEEAHEDAIGYNPEYNEPSGSGVLSRTGNSMRFDNYQALKLWLGHPEYADLSLSGKMRESIVITDVSPDKISLGFTDDEQEAKMRRNDTLRNFWGLSERDQDAVFEVARTILDQRIDSL